MQEMSRIRPAPRDLTDPRPTHSTHCRSCGAEGLDPILDLGAQPLANSLRRPADLADPQPRYPLELALCTRCSLVQILDSVPPEHIFSDYPYFSSVSAAFVEHARAIAMRLIDAEGLGPDSLVVELASNDGYLLRHYLDAGVPVLGIEPAANVAEVAEAGGVPTLCEFFTEEVGTRLAGDGVRADVVHANNVLAHVPDLNGFVAGIAELIAHGGCAVIEAPYVKNLLDACEFDTIYHEHLCYFSVTALDRLFRAHDLRLEDVERIPIHGGSLRLTARRSRWARPVPRVAEILAEERAWGVTGTGAYRAFAQEVLRAKRRLRELLARLKSDGATIAAYGAAAKGSTLLNTFAIGSETLDFVVDASPHKQGWHMPGSGLAIRPPAALVDEKPDYVLLLAWNFDDEILEQQDDYRRGGGRFIVPIPEPRIV